MTDDIDDDAEAKDRITSISIQSTTVACCSKKCLQVKMDKSHIAKRVKKHYLEFDRTWNSQLWLNEAMFHISGVEVTMIYLEKDEKTLTKRLRLPIL